MPSYKSAEEKAEALKRRLKKQKEESAKMNNAQEKRNIDEWRDVDRDGRRTKEGHRKAYNDLESKTSYYKAGRGDDSKSYEENEKARKAKKKKK